MEAQPIELRGSRGPEKERVILPIGGMHCASCVARVEGVLKELRGVNSAAVSLPSRTAVVEYDPKLLDPAQLLRAVESSGFEALGLASNYQQAESIVLAGEEADLRQLRWRLMAGAALWGFLLLAEPWELSVYTSWILGTIVQFWCGWHFHAGLWESAANRRADMNTLVSLSTWAAYLFSTWIIFLPSSVPAAVRSPMLETSAGLIVVVTLGRWIEVRLRRRTRQALAKLLRLTPKTVRVQRGAGEEVLPLEEVSVGDRILIGPGEQIGLDGVVEEGSSTVDESLLTGETEPMEKSPGARVFGGTMNKTGALIVAVTQRGSEMALAKIVEAVRRSAESKAPVQKVVDRVAAWFVPAVLALAVVSAAAWLWKGPEPRTLHAIEAFVSVLAVACPCALGLATPMAILLGSSRASQLGILFRNAEVLEKVGRIDAVMFDKTGTLTEGRPSVVEILAAAPGAGEKHLLGYALTAEQRSEHPYAEAVRRKAAELGMRPRAVDSFEALPGRGVVVASRGEKVRVGSLAWIEQEGIAISGPVAAAVREAPGSALGVAVDEQFLGAILVADRLRESAREAVEWLKAMKMDLILVSGDRNRNVHKVAEMVGIGKAYAEVLPLDKSKIVTELQERGKKVAVVGEGFNDAPALSQADIGIALASGTDIAAESADITLMNPDLRTLVTAILLSRRIRLVIRENLAWAFLYNILLIPLAAGAFYSALGWTLKPQLAGAAMALSSISVVLNSMKLRRFKT